MPQAFLSSWASLGLRGLGLLAYGIGLIVMASQAPELARWLLLPLLLTEGLNALSLGLRSLPQGDEAAPPLAEGLLAIAATVVALAAIGEGSWLLIEFLAAVAIVHGGFQWMAARRASVDERSRRLLVGMALVPIGSGVILLLHPLVALGELPAVWLGIIALACGALDVRLGVHWRQRKQAIRARADRHDADHDGITLPA